MPNASVPPAFAALVALAWSVTSAASAPTQTTITVDGNDRDWGLVLLNPENTSRDDDGSTLSCLDSRDLDCPIAPPANDLAHFAWTLDGSTLAVRVERYAPGNATLLVYVDADGDSLMEDDEPVLLVPLDSTGASQSTMAQLYTAAMPGGDPIASPAGATDGWPMRGTLQPSGVPAGRSMAVDLEGRVHEADGLLGPLRLGGREAASFHVSLAESFAPLVIADNMASRRLGGDGSGFRQLAVDGPFTAAGAPGNTVELAHLVANEGSLPAIVNVEGAASVALAVETWADLDDDLFAETLLAVDADGDGALAGPSDRLYPAGDSDGDGLLDIGVVEGFATRRVVFKIGLPPASEGLRATLDVAVADAAEPASSAAVTDELLSGAITIDAPPPALGSPGDSAWLLHVVTRHSGLAGPLDLWSKSDEAWPQSIYEDVLRTGRLEDAVPAIDSDASSLPDISLAPGESRLVWLRVDVPLDALLGLRDGQLLRALEGGLPVADGTSAVTAAAPVSLTPDHLVEAGGALRGAPGQSVWFPHVLVHALGSDEPVALTASSDLGWTVTLHADPDGDGRPYDAEPLPEPVLVQPGRNGGELRLLARVDVPPAVAIGDVARTTITATPAAAAGRSATALADAVASLVRTYEDETHAVAVSRVPACSPVHALASGLPPSTPGFRFVWRAPDGSALAVLETSADALGRCTDAWTPATGQRGEGFRVDIQEADGAAWRTLDSAPIAIDDLADAGLPNVIDAPYHLSGRDFRGEVAVTNVSSQLSLTDLELRWVVLSADETALLQETGTFAPWTGSEWTRREFLSLAPGETVTRSLSVRDVSYPSVGDHLVKIVLGSRCGELGLFSTASFAVVDDADGDGLTLSEELGAGTDPEDPDTDDDGLADGLDGTNDSDGDGALDALDCDSDDDGLFDGLEAGSWRAGPGTDAGKGCFRADLWPLSTTDPDRLDSDSGGVPDGVEDADANGRIDAGETDPNVAADDPPCDANPAPELTGLLMRHAGGQLLLDWDAATLDACSAYVVLSGASPRSLARDGARLPAPRAERDLSAAASYWLVGIDSALAGLGELGR